MRKKRPQLTRSIAEDPRFLHITEERNMEKYMNAPMEPSWTVQDIIAEYEISKDKKTISRRYQIPVSDVTKILRGTAVCGK